MRHQGRVRKASGEELVVTFAAEHVVSNALAFSDVRTEDGAPYEAEAEDEFSADFADVVRSEVQRMYPSGVEIEVTAITAHPRENASRTPRFIQRRATLIGAVLLVALFVSAVIVGGPVYELIVAGLVFPLLIVARSGAKSHVR